MISTGQGRAGHDTGAKRGEIVLGKVGVVEHGDEHGGHAVDGDASFVLDRREGRGRVEGVGGIDDGGATGGAAEVAHHHAEAVVEGNGDAEAVAGLEPLDAGDAIGVVEDVVMGESCALGEAGGARGILNVDGVVELERALAIAKVVRGRAGGAV